MLTSLGHKKQYMNTLLRNIICAAAITVGLGGCTSNDCPLNNTVRLICGFYYSSDPSASLSISDTLTIAVRDSIILNRTTNTSTVSLPMSYSGLNDSLVFRYTPMGSDSSSCDTLIVSKTNEPHVISLECGTGVFHTITATTCTSHTPNTTFRYAIDSVVISKPNVNFDGQENLKIYFSVAE